MSSGAFTGQTGAVSPNEPESEAPRCGPAYVVRPRPGNAGGRGARRPDRYTTFSHAEEEEEEEGERRFNRPV